MKTIFAFILLIVGFCSPWRIKAQNADVLFDKATMLYQQGRVDSCAEVLQQIIGKKRLINKTAKSSRADIFRLAAQTDYILERPELAVGYVKKMLAYRPSYIARETDLESFRQDMEVYKQKLRPLIRLTLSGGGNTTAVQLITDNNLLEFSDNSSFAPGTYSQYIGSSYQYNAGIEYSITKNMATGTALSYISQRFYYNTNNILYGSPFVYSFEQQQTYATLVPLYAKYYFVRQGYHNKLIPYAKAGYMLKQLLQANRKESADISMPVDPSLAHTIAAIHTGIGLNYNFLSVAIGAEINYNYSLSNTSNERINFADNKSDLFIFKYYESADDFRLNDLQFNICFTYFLSYKVF